MNLTDFETTPLHQVVETIRAEAERDGVAIAGTEIIGFVPKVALERAADFYLACENFRSEMVLENRLAELLPFGWEDSLDELEDPGRSRGGGSAAAMAASLASALGVLVCRLMKLDPEIYRAHRRFFTAASEADAQVFARLMKTSEPDQDSLFEAARWPVEIAERGKGLASDLKDLRAVCPPVFLSDVVTAAGLANACREGAIATARINLPRISDGELRRRLEARLEAVE